MDSRVEMELGNLAGPHPLARLRAIHALGEILRAELDEWIERAELEQVRVARRGMGAWVTKAATWKEIGQVLGVSHTQAQRRFKDRL